MFGIYSSSYFYENVYKKGVAFSHPHYLNYLF